MTLKPGFIYLVRKSALGDVLWIEPVIRQLASRYKRVYVYTKYNELFDNYPLKNVYFKSKLTLAEKILINTERICRTGFFSVNLDMAYEKDPRKHILHAYQAKAGLPLTQEYPQLHLNSSEKQPYPGITVPYVVLHNETFTTRNYRRVFGIDWEAIVRHINNSGFEVVQIGKNPQNISGVTNLKTSVRQLVQVLNKASFFIGIDSGPSHIAASLAIPSLVFFGAVNPQFRHFPEIFRGFFLQQPCEFAGCYHESKLSIEGPVCRLVGNDGTPKCSLHSDQYVIYHINLLLRTLRNEYSTIHTKN